MKILSVNPGKAYYHLDRWGYYIILQTVHGREEYHSDILYDSASAAKQAMREKVAQERKKHCV